MVGLHPRKHRGEASSYVSKKFFVQQKIFRTLEISYDFSRDVCLSSGKETFLWSVLLIRPASGLPFAAAHPPFPHETSETDPAAKKNTETL